MAISQSLVIAIVLLKLASNIFHMLLRAVFEFRTTRPEESFKPIDFRDSQVSASILKLNLMHMYLTSRSLFQKCIFKIHNV